MGYDDPALRHHSSEVPIAQPVGDVPANAQLDDFSVEHPSAVDGVRGDRLGHSEPLHPTILRPTKKYGSFYLCSILTVYVRGNKVPPAIVKAVFKLDHPPPYELLSRSIKAIACSNGERNEPYVLPTLVPCGSLAPRA